MKAWNLADQDMSLLHVVPARHAGVLAGAIISHAVAMLCNSVLLRWEAGQDDFPGLGLERERRYGGGVWG